MLGDLRETWRALCRARSTAVVLLLSVAVGTGANASLHGLLRELLQGPAGFSPRDDLVEIFTSDYGGLPYGPSSRPDFLDMRTAKTLAAAGAVDDGRVENVRLDGARQSSRIVEVTGALFEALGVEPGAGRLLGPEDDGAPVAAVSERLARLAGGNVVGRQLIVGDRAHRVVGVLPERLRGLHAGREADVWIPMQGPAAARGDRRCRVIARLAAGGGLDAAGRELREISERLAALHPATNRGMAADESAARTFVVEPYAPVDPPGRLRLALVGYLVAGAAALLFASACLNTGGLLVSNSIARRREVSIRKALGAGRRVLARRFLVESVSVFTAGALVGLIAATWTRQAVPVLFAVAEDDLAETPPAVGAVLLAMAAAAIAGVVFGAVTGRYGTRPPAADALRGAAGGVAADGGARGLRAVFVSVQVGVSSALLLLTAALVTHVGRALDGNLGAAARRAAVVSIELPGRFADPVRGIAARDRILARAGALDGVESVGWASTLPLGRGNARQFHLGPGGRHVADVLELQTNVVSRGYFAAVGLTLVEGRYFDDGDTPLATPVVVVDELLARRYFGMTALDRDLAGSDGRRARIVGIVRAGRHRALQPAEAPTVYYAASQDYLWRGHLVARTSGDPAALVPVLQRAATDAGAEAILEAMPLAEHLAGALALDRVLTAVIGFCGVLALVLSAVGCHGVMADAVRRRTREIGLRMALGATRRHLVWLVLAEALHPAAAGLALGGAATLALLRVLGSIVDGAPSADAIAWARATGVLAAALGVAAIVPLRRALRLEPISALRVE